MSHDILENKDITSTDYNIGESETQNDSTRKCTVIKGSWMSWIVGGVWRSIVRST